MEKWMFQFFLSFSLLHMKLNDENLYIKMIFGHNFCSNLLDKVKKMYQYKEHLD